ncbi:hypothetical protein CEXT_281891 [Caerostris extrusa]|uniref:Uncharacterized protein n=1 Tax=Caerostris extrusa TaxID=172846 RepID=A0AAV4TKP4_CAEEX|nr:hypothetical protein CEXT_281891 [Caerostris extrusa]
MHTHKGCACITANHRAFWKEGLVENKSEKDGRGYYRTLICHGLSGVTAGFLSRRLINSDRTKRGDTPPSALFWSPTNEGKSMGKLQQEQSNKTCSGSRYSDNGRGKISQSHKSLPKCIFFPILNW